MKTAFVAMALGSAAFAYGLERYAGVGTALAIVLGIAYFAFGDAIIAAVRRASRPA